MAGNRLFLPQDAVDFWLAGGKVTIEDDLMTIVRPGVQLRLRSGLRFMEEVAEGRDPHGLVGKVKSLEDVDALNGEHYADSVVLGDNAYQVVEGFLADLLPATVPSGSSTVDAVRAWLAEE